MPPEQTLPGYPHEALTDPAEAGLRPRRLQAVVDRFRRQQATGGFPGGQLAVRVDGKLVVDCALGDARGIGPGEDSGPVAVRTDTRFPVFSAGKAVLAVIVAMLEERGQIDVAAPVARYFPEFARNGKESITVLDVLTHRAGVLMPDFCRDPDGWLDWDRVVEAMCDVQPTSLRGVLAYHPFEYGWILAELVHRVDGRDVPTFLREELAEPLGLPALRFGARPDELADLAHNYWLGTKPVQIGALEVSELLKGLNTNTSLHTGFVPGAGLVSDAGTLAAFYAFLVRGGRDHDGRSMVAEDRLRRWTSHHVKGWDRSNRAPIALGRGFFLGTWGPTLYGLWNTRSCFGHAGAFCTVAWADWSTGLSAAVVTNANRHPRDLVARMLPLCEGLRQATRRSGRRRLLRPA